jgi:hypothetical protein
MILTLLRRSQEAIPARPYEEIWIVRVGRSEGDSAANDVIPSSLLAPEIDVAQLYRFDEFRLRVERFTSASTEGSPASDAWTALSLRIRWAQGELDEPITLRVRQAADMAVRGFVSFVREAFSSTDDLWVRVE